MARKFSPKEYSRTTKSIRFTVLAGLRCIFESIRLNFVNSQNNRVLCEKYSIAARTETDQALINKMPSAALVAFVCLLCCVAAPLGRRRCSG